MGIFLRVGERDIVSWNMNLRF